MNLADLVEEVAKRTGTTKTAANLSVRAVFDTIEHTLSGGEDVAIHGFGTWSVKETAARNGVNPKTGAAIKIEAGRKVAFKVSTTLRSAVRES